MAPKHIVVVFRKKDVSLAKMYGIAETIFKRLPTRICYQRHQKIDPQTIETIARTIGFCFKYPEATFSFSETKDAVFAEEFIEESMSKNSGTRESIERVNLV